MVNSLKIDMQEATQIGLKPALLIALLRELANGEEDIEINIKDIIPIISILEIQQDELIEFLEVARACRVINYFEYHYSKTRLKVEGVNCLHVPGTLWEPPMSTYNDLKQHGIDRKIVRLHLTLYSLTPRKKSASDFINYVLREELKNKTWLPDDWTPAGKTSKLLIETGFSEASLRLLTEEFKILRQNQNRSIANVDIEFLNFAKSRKKDYQTDHPAFTNSGVHNNA